MAQCTIENFWFLSLDGAVQPPSQRIEPFQRPGVAGTGFVAQGYAGVPFVLRSRVDGVNRVVCAQAFEQYVALKDSTPVNLVKGGLAYAQALNPFRVKVLDVRLVVIHDAIVAAGGLNPPSLAWMEADWTLIAVEI